MSKVNLYLNIYFEQNEGRRRELQICYQNNLIAGFDEIWLVVEQKDEEYALGLLETYNEGNSTIHLKIVNERPSIQVLLDLSKKYDQNTLHCMCNSDIYIEKAELNKLKELDWNKRLFIALSRWDLTPEGAFLLERVDSADFWCWKGPSEIEGLICKWGPGADNRLAWEFHNRGYKVVNPSKDLQVFHLHQIAVNNYRQNGQGDVIASSICPEPYYFHPNCFRSEI